MRSSRRSFGDGRQILEVGHVFAKGQLDDADGAIAVLREMQQGDPGLVITVVILGAVNQYYNVRDVFQRPAISQITERGKRSSRLSTSRLTAELAHPRER